MRDQNYSLPPCPACDGDGYEEHCRGEGGPGDCWREPCRVCHDWQPEEDPRERGDDDGTEYSDPRDAGQE